MYAKMIVLVLLTDLFLSAMTGLGVYFGFSLYPAAWSGSLHNPDSAGFRMFIPMWMPSARDLKSPLSFLPANGIGSIGWSILISAGVLIVQSFARAIFLGGIKCAVLRDKPLPLLQYGRLYFRRMFVWSALFLIASASGSWMMAAFGWSSSILLFAAFLYSLVPYLVVLLDCPLGHAFRIAPRLYFQLILRLLPFGVFTMLVTGLMSVLVQLHRPIDLYVSLVVYSMVGTLLIAEFMNQLARVLQTNSYLPEHKPGEAATIRLSRWKAIRIGALILLLPAITVWTATGVPFSVLDRLRSVPAEKLDGVSSCPCPILPRTQQPGEVHPKG
ncbi:hypothetical protein PV433_23800 [Paenibacillus sp. GYB004]|uniref:hypothetical protein n=1 Tax=Paenibacillus sp. GYB004 TaxID=2994393 RepID=UPI002F96B3BE